MNRVIYLCRALRPTRVYQSPNDQQPSDKILPAGILFYSANQITIHNKIYCEITNPFKKDVQLPLEYWCPMDSLDCTIIDTEEYESVPEHKIERVNVSLFVTNNSTRIYTSYDSTTPVTNTLKEADLLLVDRMYQYKKDARTEKRYHITNVVRNGEDITDAPEVGMWIMTEYQVEQNGIPLTFKNSGIMTLAAVTPTAATSAQKSTSKTISTAKLTDNKKENVVVSGGNAEDTNRMDANQASVDEVYENYGFNYNYIDTTIMNIPLGRLVFVHGMPFQYTYLTDRRNYSTQQYGKSSIPDEVSVLRVEDGNEDMYGRTFAREIVANMPICTVVPGVPKFMTNVKEGLFGFGGGEDDARNNWIPLWSDLTDNELEGAIQNLLETNDNTYQYYTMEINTRDYFNYVNALCWTSAKFMDLTDFEYHGTTCDKIDWGEYNSAASQDYTAFEEVLGVDGGVSFAFDPLSSITDSLTNSTQESQFSGMLNGLSSKARELEFMLGYGTGQQFEFINSEDYEAAISKLSDNSGITGAVSNFANRAKDLFMNTAHGMNIRFPELWQDSQSTKSYSIEMHFIAPYATGFCKWRYVLVPFFHWFCLAAPRSDETITNYQRPFLIRAFSKGYFNVEMGIIESISWKRYGDGDMISSNGIPTQIDVTVDFRDLYQQLAMSKFGNTTLDFSQIGIFFNNTGLLDLIGTLSGVDVNRISLGERISLYASSAAGALSATGRNFMRHFSDRTQNLAQRYLLGL